MRLSAAAAMLGAHCSFLGSEFFAEEVHGNGIAPWMELGNVEFCRAHERIVPASRDPLGVCVLDEARSFTSCDGPADCASRQRCVCGRCAALACQGDEDCGTDFVCDRNEPQPRCAKPCASSDDCTEEELCQLGVCRKPCEEAANCQTGEVCSSTLGRCIAAVCETTADCLEAETCLVQHTPAALVAPAVVSHGEDLVMYLESEGGVLRAVSADGLSYRLDPSNPVLEGSEPAPLLRDDGVTLFFVREGQIFRAESVDGIEFGSAQVVAEGNDPTAIEIEGVVTLFFSRAGKIWRTDPDESPVLDRTQAEDPLLWRDIEALEEPTVLVVVDDRGPIVRLFFAARGIESSSAMRLGEPIAPRANHSIGYAASDGGAFESYPFNPVFDRTLSYLDHLEETGPSVVVHEGRDLLYFEAGPVGLPRADNIAVALHPPPLPE